MKIAFISYDYPNGENNSFPFVKQLVEALARRGNECYVIAPHSVTKNKSFHRQLECKILDNRGKIVIIRPNYLSFSKFTIFGFSITDFLHKKAVERALKSLNDIPDVIYGHFWKSAFEGYSYAHANKIPLIVATGESEVEKDAPVAKKLQPFYDYVSGVICVSSQNRTESIRVGLTTSERCVIVPNAVNDAVFKKIDKIECRKRLGISNDKFIVTFVGWFNDRKGVMRVSEAIKKLVNVYSIFIGAGDQDPDCDNIIFKGRVAHEEIPFYLNASDLFVLPTLHEGCCNAVVEAMACGLPVVSSDRSFNYDILDGSNSIMIDPNDIDAIANAIRRIQNNSQIREELSCGALRTSAELTINKRAEAIETFIKKQINYNDKF